MKKLSIVAIVVVALVFGSVAWATAADEYVDVTATISAAFEMAASGNSFAFGTLSVGDNSTIPGPQITVKSNKPWTYTEHAATCTENLLLPFASQAGAVDSGTEGSRGVFKKSYDYNLNLDASNDAVYEIPAETPMTLTYQYTAVQN
jgi:hypothetical protein